MRALIGIFIVGLAFTGNLFAQNCETLFHKLSSIPSAIETVQRIKTLYEGTGKESSTQHQLRTRATQEALKDLNLNLKPHGVTVQPHELVELFKKLESRKEISDKEKAVDKTQEPKPIELPKELDTQWRPPGGSFQNRNHADAQKFQLPENFKIVERQVGEFFTAGEIDSSPTFGPDGLIAVGSDDGHVYFYEKDPLTQEISEVAKMTTGARVSSSPAFGPNGLVVVGSRDRKLHVYQIVPDDTKKQGASP